MGSYFSAAGAMGDRDPGIGQKDPVFSPCFVARPPPIFWKGSTSKGHLSTDTAFVNNNAL